jgi:hypothetical protein
MENSEEECRLLNLIPNTSLNLNKLQNVKSRGASTTQKIKVLGTQKQSKVRVSL